MKIESKLILPLFENIKSLLESHQECFRELEDLEQCEDVTERTFSDIRELLSSFKLKHLIPVDKTPKSDLPAFMGQFNKLIDRQYNGEHFNHTSSEERILFMGKFYLAMTRKLISDPADHYDSEKQVRHHIEVYLVGNDNDWNYYLGTELSQCMYKVIDTLVEEIKANRFRNPQMKLDIFDTKDQTIKSNSLIDIM